MLPQNNPAVDRLLNLGADVAWVPGYPVSEADVTIFETLQGICNTTNERVVVLMCRDYKYTVMIHEDRAVGARTLLSFRGSKSLARTLRSIVGLSRDVNGQSVTTAD